MVENTFRIRLAGPDDEAAAYAVCLQTGDSGRDATRLHTDPQALGRIYVGPYLRFEPDLAYVLEDAAGVCGYILGALDSARFYRAYTEEWLPPLRELFPEPIGDAEHWSETQQIYYQYHHPDIYFPESFRDYPSHLHIDLLPRAQGRGWGTAMMRRLLAALIARGSTGVHLGLSPENRRADAFYRKLGFVELARAGVTEPQTLYLGRRLG